MASEFYDNAVFWIEVSRIHPNPFQPRREFNEAALLSLADSIRQYGVLQPLVVTRKESERGDGGISVEYELIAGERRLRASKLARLTQVPVLIRSSEDTDKAKLEIAIIENLQREDLNPIDRARAFKQLADNFKLKHVEIAKKIGKSREYVSNTLRLLALPDEVQNAVIAGRITEGHTRPILMLVDRPEQQQQLFEEISAKKLTVREAERIARGIAVDRARKHDLPPELAQLERELTEHLGTRVQIEPRANGGKVHIDFFTQTDIVALLARIDAAIPPVEAPFVEQTKTEEKVMVDEVHESQPEELVLQTPLSAFVYNHNSDIHEDNLIVDESIDTTEKSIIIDSDVQTMPSMGVVEISEAVSEEEQEESDDEDLYSLNNFAI